MSEFVRILGQIEIISEFSAHKRKCEIADILSTVAAYRIKSDDYLKYYEVLVTEEIKERLADSILGYLDQEDKQKAWKTIINALGNKEIYNIMNEWEMYVGKYITIENQLADIRKILYKDFLSTKGETVSC